MDKRLPPLRQWLNVKSIKLSSYLVNLAFGYKAVLTRHTLKEVDYSKYLGPKWRETPFLGKRCSTMVSNHVGFLETTAYIDVLTLPPSYLCAEFFKKLPGHSIVLGLQSIFVDRTSDKAGLEAQVKRLGEIQKERENSEEDCNPIIFFAEGAVTNGRNLTRFKRGPFLAEVAMKPMWFKFNYKNVSADYSCMQALWQGLVQLSEFRFNQTIECHEYPIFVPNEYLFTEYAKTLEGHEKMERWEIYSLAIRDFIKKEGGFGDNLQSNKDMLSLRKFLWGQTDEITVNGKTFYWPPRGDSAQQAKKEQ